MKVLGSGAYLSASFLCAFLITSGADPFSMPSTL